MSDLKYKTVEELQQLKKETERYMSILKSRYENHRVRLEWINRYLYEKTPQEMTWDEIEAKLGHKVIIK